MSCAHVVVVTLLLAAVGPAMAMPHLLATGLVAAALLALCASVPLGIAATLAVGAGLLLEVAYSTATEPALFDAALRLLLLAAIAVGVGTLRRHRQLAGR